MTEEYIRIKIVDNAISEVNYTSETLRERLGAILLMTKDNNIIVYVKDPQVLVKLPQRLNLVDFTENLKKQIKIKEG